MFLHTYTFTIDIVPLVFRDYYFAGHIHEHKRIIIKIRHQTKRNVDHTPKNEKMAHPTCKYRMSNGVDTAQAHLATDRKRKVARHANQGVGTPWVQPHPRHRLSGPRCLGGIINARGGQLHRGLHV